MYLQNKVIPARHSLRDWIQEHKVISIGIMMAIILILALIIIIPSVVGTRGTGRRGSQTYVTTSKFVNIILQPKLY